MDEKKIIDLADLSSKILRGIFMFYSLLMINMIRMFFNFTLHLNIFKINISIIGGKIYA